MNEQAAAAVVSWITEHGGGGLRRFPARYVRPAGVLG